MEPSSSIDCGAASVAGLTRGSVIGAVVGLILTPAMTRIDERHFRSLGNALPVVSKLQNFRRVGAGTLSSMLVFGLFCGLYDGTTCAAARVRGKKDWVNQAFGGFCAGTVLGYGKGPRGIAATGLTVAAATTTMYLISSPVDK